MTCAAVIVVLGAGTAGGMVSAAAASSRSTAGVRHSATRVTSAAVSFTVSVTGLTPSAVTITGTGAADFTNDAVSLTIDLPGVVAPLIPGGSDAPEVVDAVFSGGTVYLDIPSLASLVGEPWISVALPTQIMSALPGVFTKAAAALGDVDAIVALATAHHATVTPLGSATVDGVPTTGTQIVTSFGPTGTASLTASLWADSSDRLVQGDLTVTGAGKTGALGLTAAVYVSNDDAPVTVTIPPSSQVKAVPFSIVAKLFGRALHRGRHRND